MSSPSAKGPVKRASEARVVELSPDLVEELREAVADIERGHFIELTSAQLETWAETGDFPWADESHD